MNATSSVPAPQQPSLRRLLMAKFGQLTCRHFFRIVALRGRMFLRCDDCGAETEGFELDPPLRGER